MDNQKIQKFRPVDTTVEELEEQIKSHRRKVFFGVLISVIIAIGIITGITLYFYFKSYTSYTVKSEIQNTNSSATKFKTFNGNILRYNNDGATYTDQKGNLIWTQAYEMEDPQVDLCETYLTISDIEGTQIYILDTLGLQGEVKTSKTIQRVRVANQGTVAVLTKKSNTSYLELYDKTGNNLASGELHASNSGFAIDIALSKDAQKLAVSMLDISTGKSNATVAIYNFGSVGQNEIDNIVASYTYKDCVIPKIEFVSNDKILAFGDNKVIIFEGTQKPKESSLVTIEEEMKSVFSNDQYFGLVFANKEKDKAGTQRILVYDLKGRLQFEQNSNIAFESVDFLDNNEICARSEHSCELFTISGRKKFSYEFEDSLYEIFSGKTIRNYVFIFNKGTQKVRLE